MIAAMEDPHFKIDNPSFPEALQTAWVGYVFRILYPFTDDEVAELTDVYLLLWSMGEKPQKRLELIRVLYAIKSKKIEEEKQRLKEQLKKLESM